MQMKQGFFGVRYGHINSITETNIHEWISEMKTILIPKGTKTGTIAHNCRLVMFLDVIWTILTAHVRKLIYYRLVSRELFPKNSKDGTGNKRNSCFTLHWSEYQQSEREKYSHGGDWLQKCLWYMSWNTGY